jgi:glutamate racemase
MKLGVFDSGMGGLVIAKAIHDQIPDIDMVYFGDTLHVPYGNRSFETICEYTRQGIEFLFSRDCNLVVIACNTASAFALRKLQDGYLLKYRPEKNILGVVVPTLETALETGCNRLGLIGTNYTVRSNVYGDELRKLRPNLEIIQQATPLLAPLIENDGYRWAKPILQDYLRPLMEKNIEALILACTHYPFLKKEIREIVGPDVSIISQDDIIPAKLAEYLRRHPEYSSKISRNGTAEFYVSDLSDSYRSAAETFYGRPLQIEKIAA